MKTRYRTVYYLEVSYPLERYDLDNDYNIRKVVGREDTGSGMGLGGRDLIFTFYREKAANKAKRRLKKKFRNKLTCEVIKDEELYVTRN